MKRIVIMSLMLVILGNAHAQYLINSQRFAPAAFSPDSIASLECWLDANQLGLANNAAVSSWTDESGNGRHFVQATGGAQPTFKTAILNGKPVVRFDGANDCLIIDEFMPSAAQGELFIVLKCVSDTPIGGDAFMAMSGDAGASLFWQDGVIYEGWGSSVRKTTGDPTPSMASTFRLYNIQSAVGAYSIFIDTASHFTTASNTASFINPANDIYVLGGADGTPSYPVEGDIAEVCIFSTVLSAGDRISMQTYFDTKYALSY